MGATFASDAKLLDLLEKPQQGSALAGQWDAQQNDRAEGKPVPPVERVPADQRRRAELIAAGEGGAGWQRVSVPPTARATAPAWKWTDGERRSTAR
jgi:hypothetical protein